MLAILLLLISLPAAATERPSFQPVAMPDWSLERRSDTGLTQRVIHSGGGYYAFLDAVGGPFVLKAQSVTNTTSAFEMHPNVSRNNYHFFPGIATFQKGDAKSVRGRNKLTETISYFFGEDPSRWYRDIPVFSQVEYPQIYAGIDLVATFEPYREIYEFTIQPGGDPSQIMPNIEGANATAYGLLTEEYDGSIIIANPVATQTGQDFPIDAGFQFVPYEGVIVTVKGYDRAKTLQLRMEVPRLGHRKISSDLTPSSGSSLRVGRQAVHPAADGGLWLVAGEAVRPRTASRTFELVPSEPVTGGGVLVTRFNRSGDAMHSTYVGGVGEAPQTAVSNDEIYLFGERSAYAPCARGAVESRYLIVKISSRGHLDACKSVQAGTSLEGAAIGVGPDRLLWLAAGADEVDQRLKFDLRAGKGESAIYVAVFDGARRLEQITSGFIGSGERDRVTAAAAGDASLFVAGYTPSALFPLTKNAFQQQFETAVHENFVLRLDLNRQGNTVVIGGATYLGAGEANPYYDNDRPVALGLTSSGDVWVAGLTTSRKFPLPPDRTVSGQLGNGDVFLVRLNRDLSRMIAGTLLGGDKQDRVESLAVAPDDGLWVFGTTESTGFPQLREGGFHVDLEKHLFLTRYNAVASKILFSTLIAGGEVDGAARNAVASMENGAVAVAAIPSSPGIAQRLPFGSTWASEAGSLLLKVVPCRGCLTPPRIGGIFDFRNTGKGIRVETAAASIEKAYVNGRVVAFARLGNSFITLQAPAGETVHDIILVDTDGETATHKSNRSVAPSVVVLPATLPEKRGRSASGLAVIGVTAFLTLVGLFFRRFRRSR